MIHPCHQSLPNNVVRFAKKNRFWFVLSCLPTRFPTSRAADRCPSPYICCPTTPTHKSDPGARKTDLQLQICCPNQPRCDLLSCQRADKWNLATLVAQSSPQFCWVKKRAEFQLTNQKCQQDTSPAIWGEKPKEGNMFVFHTNPKQFRGKKGADLQLGKLRGGKKWRCVTKQPVKEFNRANCKNLQKFLNRGRESQRSWQAAEDSGKSSTNSTMFNVDTSYVQMFIVDNSYLYLDTSKPGKCWQIFQCTMSTFHIYAGLIYLYQEKLLNVIHINVQYIAFLRKDIKGCSRGKSFLKP